MKMGANIVTIAPQRMCVADKVVTARNTRCWPLVTWTNYACPSYSSNDLLKIRIPKDEPWFRGEWTRDSRTRNSYLSNGNISTRYQSQQQTPTHFIPASSHRRSRHSWLLITRFRPCKKGIACLIGPVLDTADCNACWNIPETDLSSGKTVMFAQHVWMLFVKQVWEPWPFDSKAVLPRRIIAI